MAGKAPVSQRGGARTRPDSPLVGKLLPIAGAVALSAFAAFPSIRASRNLLASVAGAAVVLLGWAVLLLLSNRGAGRRQDLVKESTPADVVHSLTLAAFFVYWAYASGPVRTVAAPIVAQVVFAYVFDMLLVWSRRESYTLGWGLLPVVGTINLFLWFHADGFVFQLGMVAVAVLAREFLRWERNGERVPVINPVALALVVASVAIIAMAKPGLTTGEDQAALLFVPQWIYPAIVALTLPWLYLRRLVVLPLTAVLALYLFNLVHLRLTGTYFFVDSTVPVTVFLATQLLLTAAETLPTSELGRMAAGVLYAGAVVGLHALLRRFGVPTFHAVWLPVPVLNLASRALDWIARVRVFRFVSPEYLAERLGPGLRNTVYLVLWVVVFGGLSTVKALGDAHEARTVPFWYQACEDNRPNGCQRYEELLRTHCAAESGWACNELGVLVNDKKLSGKEDLDVLFNSACGFGSSAGCANRDTFRSARQDFGHGVPTLLDFRVILRQGKPLREKTPLQILARACAEGWMAGCDRLAALYFQGTGVTADKSKAAALEFRACEGRHAPACANLGLMFSQGDGVPQDRAKALDYLSKACDLGMAKACTWLDEESAKR